MHYIKNEIFFLKRKKYIIALFEVCFLEKNLEDGWSVQCMYPFVQIFKFVVSQKSTEAFS